MARPPSNFLHNAEWNGSHHPAWYEQILGGVDVHNIKFAMNRQFFHCLVDFTTILEQF
jgi:hypothetical protein